MDRGAWRATVHGVAKELDMTWQLNNNQWLGLCAFTAKGLGSIPGWETKTLKAAWLIKNYKIRAPDKWVMFAINNHTKSLPSLFSFLLCFFNQSIFFLMASK